MNRSRAVRYIIQHGTMAEKARLFYLESQQLPDVGVIESFKVRQREDGGWQPLWAEDYSSVDATCYTLARAAALGMDAGTPFFQAGLDFLQARQAPDGSWEESAEVQELAPPWAIPGDSPARVYLTANAGWTLACALGPQPPVLKAADLLKSLQSIDGSLPSFLQAVWLAAGMWQIQGESDCLRRAILFLQMRAEHMPASSMGWMLVTLLLSGFNPQAVLIQDALQRLDGLQRADGRWESDDGAVYDVHATLQALRAFKLAGWDANEGLG